MGREFDDLKAVALLAEGVDRNQANREAMLEGTVALLAEGVDRNKQSKGPDGRRWKVALLAEGVDRNTKTPGKGLYIAVALLAEGVDRNRAGKLVLVAALRSPSSRRAWIEINAAIMP